MPEFTASDPGSSFPNQNILFNSASGLTGQELQKNQLAIQGQQMDLTAADHEQVGRLAAGLLNIQDPTARAQAYAQGVGVLQSQGLAKYAPPTLPDEGSLRMLVSQSIPAADQYKMGLGQQAAQGAITALSPTASTAAPGTTTGTAAPAAGGVATTPSATIETPAFNNATAVRDGLIKRGMDPDTATAFAANALHESVANPATGRGDNGNSAGLFQWAGPRLQAYTQTYGHSPDGEPLDQQLDFVMKELGGPESDAAAKIAQAQGPAAKAAAVSQYYLRPKDTVPEMQRRSATALQLQQQIGGGATTASAAPATAQPGQPVPTQVAGPPMVSTAPPGSTAAPGGPVQPAATTAAPAQPGQPQTAQAPPTPASVQPTAAPPAVPHLVTPNGQQVPPPPGGVAVLSNGLTPQQWGLVQNELRAASAGGPAAIAAVLEKVPQLAQQNTALNMAAWKAAHPELGKIETAQGSILYNPNTGETVGTIAHAPVPTTPRFTQGAGRYNPATTQYEPATPANANLGPAVLGHWGVNNAGQQTFFADDTAATQRQKAAEAAGTAAGGLAGKLVTQLAEQGSRANQAISTIDEGIDNVQKAQQAGLNTGYFAPWISTGLAMAKSLGVDTKVLAGIDPSAVGDIQTAKKTLGLVSGQILQQILGPESQITEGKIQHFIGSQPGIETDPQALGRVLNWARSQFVYEREQAAQGMEDARTSDGILSPNWLPNYYATKGFGPIYNPNVGGMQQPDGQAPGREPPVSAPAQQTAPATPLPPKAQSSLVEGHITTFTNGQQWKLVNGQPVQVK